MNSLRWRWARMRFVSWAVGVCPSRYRVRLADLFERLHFLDIDHIEDATNDFPEFYEA